MRRKRIEWSGAHRNQLDLDERHASIGHRDRSSSHCVIPLSRTELATNFLPFCFKRGRKGGRGKEEEQEEGKEEEREKEKEEEKEEENEKEKKRKGKGRGKGRGSGTEEEMDIEEEEEKEWEEKI